MLNSSDQNEITKASAPDLMKEKDDDFGSQRVYKKTSPNSVLTLYLGTRDIICRQGTVEPLRGVIYVDPKYVSSHKIFGQLTLTFRYGREDEEVMGLKFCNEAIISLKQIWPAATDEKEELSPLQAALLERLGTSAYPFSLEVGTLAPPSVQLVPAKRYTGAPIGTSYDVRVHLADQDEDRFNRRSMVRLGVRVIHKITSETKAAPIVEPSPHKLSKSLRLRLSPKALKLTNKFSTSVDETQHRKLRDCSNAGGGSMSRIDMANHSTTITAENLRQSKGPEGSVDKPFLWTEGRVCLRASLDKSAYGHGEFINVSIDVRNDSRKIIRKIRITAVQHVDVCMFSNGKFKNIVADVTENNQIKPSTVHQSTYKMLPAKGPTKNWIAVEGVTSYSGFNSNPTANNTTSNGSNGNYKIASSAPRGPQTYEERNVFAIYVSYYIKVKLILSGMGGEVSLKLPFILGYVDDENIHISNNDDSGQKTNETNKKIEQKSTNIAASDDEGTRIENSNGATVTTDTITSTEATMTTTTTTTTISKPENVLMPTNEKETMSMSLEVASASMVAREEEQRRTNDTQFNDIVAVSASDDTSLAGTLKQKIQFNDDMGSQDIDSVEDNGRSLNLVTAQIHHQLSEQLNEEIAHET